MLKPIFAATALSTFILLAGCSFDLSSDDKKEQKEEQPISQDKETETNKNNDSNESAQRQVEVDETVKPAQAGLQTLAEPESIPVLVNKQYSLPEDYKPDDLFYPKVDFIFQDKIEKRMMRKEAGKLLKKCSKLLKKKTCILLAFPHTVHTKHKSRSLITMWLRTGKKKREPTVQCLGQASMKRVSRLMLRPTMAHALPKTASVTRMKLTWLAEHAHEYGFIIRYPKGKENITGYKYEPWHIRYVGVDSRN